MNDSPLKQNKIVPLDKLTAHPRNYRSHPEAQVSKLVSSLVRFGQGRSIVVQDGPQGYLIVAGHGIVEAAKKLQYTELRADILPADWAPEQISGYLIADNLHSQDAQDDESLLAELLQEQQNAGFDLASLGTDDESLRQMLESLGDEYLRGNESEDEEDDFDEEPDEEQTRVKLGDVWKLGRHTIACLSSTDEETYKKLLKNVDVKFVWADPPYGISLLEKRGSIGNSRAYNPVLNDGDTDIAIKSYKLSSKLFPHSVQVWWGANYYSDALPPSSCWVVWDKDHHGMTFADAELAWVNQSEPTRCFRHAWSGAHRDSERDEKRVHPTQKPCALFCWCAERYGKSGDVIFDPFLGSGISVIGAEMLNDDRVVIGCELSPEYVDIVIRRWEAHTNQQAVLLNRIEEEVHAV